MLSGVEDLDKWLPCELAALYFEEGDWVQVSFALI